MKNVTLQVQPKVPHYLLGLDDKMADGMQK